MNKQFTCDVIFDLLPIYIDGMTSRETAQVVEAHLAECDRCSRIYEEMTGELDFYLSSQQKKQRKKRYKKKNTGRMLILSYILFLLLIMVFCVLDVALFL